MNFQRKQRGFQQPRLISYEQRLPDANFYNQFDNKNEFSCFDNSKLHDD